VQFHVARQTKERAGQSCAFDLPAETLIVVSAPGAVLSGMTATPVLQASIRELREFQINNASALGMIEQVEGQAGGALHCAPVICVPVEPNFAESVERMSEDPRQRKLLLLVLLSHALAMRNAQVGTLLRSLVDTESRIFDYMERHCMNGQSVADYARELSMSERRLRSSFLRRFGVPVKKWLLGRRLERGRALLAGTSLRVVDIAVECGFGSYAHFSHTFRQTYRMSPTEYRRLHTR
jgi:AraC-like DNA-binding protein